MSRSSKCHTLSKQRDSFCRKPLRLPKDNPQERQGPQEALLSGRYNKGSYDLEVMAPAQPDLTTPLLQAGEASGRSQRQDSSRGLLKVLGGVSMG